MKAKKTAVIYVCQTKSETMLAIKQLGDAQRELKRLETAINDEIAALTNCHKETIERLAERIESLTNGIHMWCEANRTVLCPDTAKTANLITGSVSWRQRPPSVSVRAADKVISTLRALGLGRFVRTKEEVNKEAILTEPAAVAGVAGITVVSGVEDFAVEPFEVEVTA